MLLHRVGLGRADGVLYDVYSLVTGEGGPPVRLPRAEHFRELLRSCAWSRAMDALHGAWATGDEPGDDGRAGRHQRRLVRYVIQGTPESGFTLTVKMVLPPGGTPAPPQQVPVGSL